MSDLQRSARHPDTLMAACWDQRLARADARIGCLADSLELQLYSVLLRRRTCPAACLAGTSWRAVKEPPQGRPLDRCRRGAPAAPAVWEEDFVRWTSVRLLWRPRQPTRLGEERSRSAALPLALVQASHMAVPAAVGLLSAATAPAGVELPCISAPGLAQQQALVAAAPTTAAAAAPAATAALATQKSAAAAAQGDAQPPATVAGRQIVARL